MSQEKTKQKDENLTRVAQPQSDPALRDLPPLPQPKAEGDPAEEIKGGIRFKPGKELQT